MLSDLAFKNVRTQFHGYFIYFLSMSFSVMVYYSFSSMRLDKTLVKHAGNDAPINGMLHSASIMIILFIIVFMISANNFFLKKRKKEIGLYSLLGMRKSQIGWLFFVENMLLGLTSLVAGILAGVLFSKLFSMILIKIIYLDIDRRFTFSVAAVKQTTMMFLIVLFLVSFKNARTVYRYKLVELFRATQEGTPIKKTTFWTWVLGGLGIFLIGLGYFLAFNFYDISFWVTDNSDHQLFMLYFPLIILALCVTGSYLFFHKFLIVIIVLSKRFKQFYYYRLTMVTVGNLRFHLRKNATTLGTIAVLCGTALAVIGGAAQLYQFGMSGVEMRSPFVFTVDKQDYPELEKIIQEYPDYQIANKTIMTIKVTGGKIKKIIDGEEVTAVTPVNVISITNYNHLKAENKHLRGIQLDGKQNAILLDGLPDKGWQIGTIKHNVTQIVGYPEKLNLKQPRQDFIGSYMTGRYPFDTLVVADEVFEALPSEGEYSLIQFNVHNQSRSNQLNQAVAKRMTNKEYSIVTDFREDQGKVVGRVQVGTLGELGLSPQHYQEFQRYNYKNRYPDLKTTRGLFGTFVYVAIFLGIVFLIATGSIITLKQLSEAQEEKERYAILRKLGVSKREITRSIYQQNLFVFLLPIVLAILHAIFALALLVAVIPTTTYYLPIIACGFLIFLYSLFYFTTATAYNRIVNP